MTFGAMCATCLIGYAVIVIGTVRWFHRVSQRRQLPLHRRELSDDTLARLIEQWSK